MSDDPYRVLQSTNGSRYVEEPSGYYHFDEAARHQLALSYSEWRHYTARKEVVTSTNDHEALAQILCLVSRPHNPNQSLSAIQHYCNEVTRLSYGRPHPMFANRARRKRAEILAPFQTTDRRLRRALEAGRALDHVWSNCYAPGNFGKVFAEKAGEVLGEERIDPASYERKKLFTDYKPIIHMASALRHALIGAGFDTDTVGPPAGALLGTIINFTFDPSWIAKLLIAAEERAYDIYFQELVPAPEKMIRFVLRSNDDALSRGLSLRN